MSIDSMAMSRCDSRVPPKQVVKAEASRLRGGGILPRIPPAQRPHPDKVQVGPGMVVHILFHQGAGKTMRDDPDAVSFGEVPSLIPCNGSFGAHVGKAGMTNYEDVQLLHLRSFQNVELRSAPGGARASSTLSKKFPPLTTHWSTSVDECPFKEVLAAHGVAFDSSHFLEITNGDHAHRPA
jgi:hypothetical protein